jgi:hypothetical protein
VSFGGQLSTAWDLGFGPKRLTVQVGLEIQSTREHGRLPQFIFAFDNSDEKSYGRLCNILSQLK